MARSSGLAALLLVAPAAFALGPHEFALIVNTNSVRSMAVANQYIQWRSVPQENVIPVGLAPDPAPQCEIGREEFERAIWKPVNAEIARRGLSGHLLAWVYSVDFPTTIRMDPLVSLQGLTHLRNRTPTSNEVDRAAYGSPLFRGPARDDAPAGPALTLEQFAVNFGTNYPLAVMQLGQCSPRGMTEEEVLANLRIAARCDGSQPNGAINFVVSDDVRSRCRAWQLPAAQRELAQMGVRTVVTTGRPDRASFLMGLQMGAQRIDDALDVKLQPGSMAEHLTSFGAAFNTEDQSKITLWLKAGAAGSSGTVTEPYALWPKFPHARFYAHYASGCTLLEAFAQSIANPLQVMLLGDPLARPYASTPPLTLVCTTDDDEALRGDAAFLLLTGEGGPINAPGIRLIYLLDGRPLSLPPTATSITINTANLDDGWHELRAVAYAGGAIKAQGFATKRFGVANRRAAPVLTVKAGASLACSVSTTDSATRVSWLVQGREVAGGTATNITVDRSMAGWGPVFVQAVVTHADERRSWSRRVAATLARPAQ